MYSRYTDAPQPSPLTNTTSAGIHIHACAQDMPHLPVGRFARRSGSPELYAFACRFPAGDEPGRALVSHDQGATWEPLSPFGDPASLHPTDSGAFLCSRSGTLIAAFANRAEMVRTEWDPALPDPATWRVPTYVARSVDGGQTWVDVQKLHDDWTGANRDMIQTRDGRVVFTSMKLLGHPGRHSVMTYASDDGGATWTASNVIDLGGNGHHGGVTEATLIELRDGRLLKYIRTNWGQLWRALSDDGGHHWHPYGPAGIDASSTPAFLERLASGRIVLVWNREFPEGQHSWTLTGGDGNWSAVPASNFRHELSISFSDDECDTWSAPVVIARSDDSEVSYPYAFEPEPGLLWITAHRFGLRMQLREEDLVRR